MIFQTDQRFAKGLMFVGTSFPWYSATFRVRRATVSWRRRGFFDSDSSLLPMPVSEAKHSCSKGLSREGFRMSALPRLLMMQAVGLGLEAV